MAHDFGEEGHDSIDILIGSDYYWDIVTGETERDFRTTAVNRKPVFLKTGKFGIEPPFTYTGLNFASPLYTRCEKDNISSPDPANVKT